MSRRSLADSLVLFPAAAVVSWIALIATSASAQDAPPSLSPLPAPAPALETAPAPTGADTRESMWRIEAGFRGSFVPSAAFDPFATNDFLPEFSVAATRTLFAAGHLSLALGLGWDYAKTSATARGDSTSLSVQRISAPIEGRVHLGPVGYLFVRAAPGATVERAEVDDAAAAAPLEKSRWLFSTDLSGGFAWLVFPRTREPSATARFWLQADGGYGWVAANHLDLSPALASSDGRVISGTDLGSLDMSGAFFRIDAAVSF